MFSSYNWLCALWRIIGENHELSELFAALQKEIAVVSTTSAVALLGSVFAFRLRRVGGKHLP